ncbi:hypothetical protein KUCAC02_000049 [Chaenocephalus aceratus]|nr:hypothetical protein KUCAC02_000049 [Chaenocephalus aceratus]
MLPIDNAGKSTNSLLPDSPVGWNSPRIEDSPIRDQVGESHVIKFLFLKLKPDGGSSNLGDLCILFSLLASPSRLFFGTLYPAYYSYKAVKTKNVKEYVRWMMYWIVFALYTVVEAVTDLTLAWFPLYYELKIAFVIWLLSPYTRGASLIYRKCLHPLLSSREREIDEYIVQAKERSYETMVNFGKQGLSIAATAAVSAAVKGQGAITEKLRSLSMHDLTQISQQDDRGDQLYQYSSHSSNPAIRRSQSTDAADGPGSLWIPEDQRQERPALSSVNYGL